MKKIDFYNVLALVFLFLSVTAQNKDNSRIIRVLSFNIFHGQTMNRDYNLDVIAQVIKDSKPDLVALQEVHYKTKMARGYDISTELAYRTKMIPLFAKAIKREPVAELSEYGNAILSNWSFLQTRKIDLPHSPEREKRVVMEALIIIPSGDTIAFINTHFDHTGDPTDRIAQANKINDVFLSNKYPTILAGDLNAEPGSQPINILEKYWISTYNKIKPEATFPSDNPTKKIDYIMFYPQNKFKIIESKVIKDSIASDHCAYLVILELLK